MSRPISKASDSKHSDSKAAFASPQAGVRPRREVAPFLLVLPAAIIFLVFYVVPMVNLFASSFYRFDPSLGVIPAFTLANYSKFLRDSFYLGVLWRTLRISLVVTLAALLVGYPVAYYLTQVKGRARSYLTLLVLSPLLISMVIRTYGWAIILSKQGAINSFLAFLGWEKELNLLYTETGVEIGLTHIFVSFMVLAIMGALERIDPSILRAAQNLGASPAATFLKVILPLSLPGILAGSAVVFSLSSSAFVTPSILGGPQARVVSYITFEQDLVLLNWPFGAAVAFILLFITAALLTAYSRILEKGRFGVVFQ